MSPVERTTSVLNEVYAERRRQREKFGEQHYRADGTHKEYKDDADFYRRECDRAEKEGKIGATWTDILLEETYEALAEEVDLVKLRRELVQVAAVAVAWIEALDARTVD